MPHKTGTVDEGLPVTVNASVKHCDAVETVVPVAATSPNIAFVVVVVKVLGPVMAKFVKSSRI